MRFPDKTTTRQKSRRLPAPRRNGRLPCVIAVFLTASLLTSRAESQLPSTLSAPQPARENLNNVQSEIVFGQNAKGPYRLGWKGIRVGSEVIIRDGIKLTRERDYTLAPDSGLLVFAEPLASGQMARVTYRCDLPESEPNIGPTSMQTQFDLFQSGRNRASLLAQYRMDAGATEPTTLPLLQLSGGTALSSHSDLATAMFVDLRGGDLLSRSAVRVSERTKLQFADLSFGYSRGGALFENTKLSGIAAGREMMEANGAFSLARGLKLNSFLRHTTELRDTTRSTPENPLSERGLVTKEQGAALELALANRGKLETGRTETRLTPPSGEGSVKVQDIVKVDGALDKNTQATVGFESVTTRPEGGESDAGTYSQTSSVDFRNRPNDLYLFSGGYRNILGTGGVQDVASLRMEATPFARMRQLKLRAGFEERYAADGARRSREALVDLPTLGFGQTQISGGVRMSSDPGSERMTGLLDAKMRPVRYVDISGSVRIRDGMRDNTPDAELANTYDVQMAFSPVRQFRLTGNMTQNPGLGDSFRRSQMRALGMETQLGSATFKGKYGFEDEYANARLSRLMEVSLDLRLSRWNSLSAGYQTRSIENGDVTDSLTYLFSFRHDMSSIFNLSLGGSMTMVGRDGRIDSGQTEIRGEAKLGIKF